MKFDTSKDRSRAAVWDCKATFKLSLILKMSFRQEKTAEVSWI